MCTNLFEQMTVEKERLATARGNSQNVKEEQKEE